MAYFKVSKSVGDWADGERLAANLVDDPRYPATVWHCVDVYKTQSEADWAKAQAEPCGWTYVADADGLSALTARYGKYGVETFSTVGYEDEGE